MQPQEIDIQYLLNTTRARIYLLWAVLVTGGFVATHFYQDQNINIIWTIISVIGLGYMLKTMPMRVGQMRRIFFAWFVPIVLGMVVSGAVFYVDSVEASKLIAHLGAFWLLVMSTGYFLNGLVDAPSNWYWFAAALNLVAGLACFIIPELLPTQYLIAAIVSAWSMLNLWIFRS
jgi:hypothetical protein